MYKRLRSRTRTVKIKIPLWQGCAKNQGTKKGAEPTGIYIFMLRRYISDQGLSGTPLVIRPADPRFEPLRGMWVFSYLIF